MQQPAPDLDLTALPPEVQAQFNEHLACLAKLCREHKLDAKQVGQAVTKAVTKRLSLRLCEDCDSKQPSFGMDDEQKMRWCAGCAKAHGAVSLRKEKQCEDCGLKRPTFGVAGERKRRWCSGCGKARDAVRLQKPNERRQCEDCDLKVPKFGLESEQKVRWCGTCAKTHGGVNQNIWCAASTAAKHARSAQRKRAAGRASTGGATKRGPGQNGSL